MFSCDQRLDGRELCFESVLEFDCSKNVWMEFFEFLKVCWYVDGLHHDQQLGAQGDILIDNWMVFVCLFNYNEKNWNGYDWCVNWQFIGIGMKYILQWYYD